MNYLEKIVQNIIENKPPFHVNEVDLLANKNTLKDIFDSIEEYIDVKEEVKNDIKYSQININGIIINIKEDEKIKDGIYNIKFDDKLEVYD